MSQYTSMYDGWTNRSYDKYSFQDVLKMQDGPLAEIIKRNPYNPMPKEDYRITLLTAIAKEYGSWDYKSLDSLLRGIYKYDSKKALES